MNFRPGDTVIRCTGGNKMVIVGCNSGQAVCVWVSDCYHEQSFKEEELLPISEYKKILTVEKRHELISKLLSQN
jgi:uncharacterized protein YodC (DUF2158 family)